MLSEGGTEVIYVHSTALANYCRAASGVIFRRIAERAESKRQYARYVRGYCRAAYGKPDRDKPTKVD